MSRYRKSALVLGVSLLAWVSLPGAATAQAVDVEVETPEPSDQPFKFQAGYNHVFETDIKNAGGSDVSYDSFRTALGGRFDLSEGLSLHTQFSYELNAYDFSSPLDSVAWDNINQYVLAGLLSWKLDEHWSLLGGPVLRLSGEGSAAFDDGFTGGGVLGFNYAPNKDLSMGLALGVVSQIEDNAAIVPIPMVRWHFVEPLTLKVGILPLGGRNGLGPELIWHLAEQVDVGFGAQYQRRRFRLDDHGFVGTRKGVGEDTSAPLYTRLTFRPIPPLSLELFGGVVVAGELTLQDDDGNNTIDKGYKSTGTLGLRGEYRF